MQEYRKNKQRLMKAYPNATSFFKERSVKIPTKCLTNKRSFKNKYFSLIILYSLLSNYINVEKVTSRNKLIKNIYIRSKCNLTNICAILFLRHSFSPY